MATYLLSIDQLAAAKPLLIYGTGTVARRLSEMLDRFLPGVDYAFLDSSSAGSCLGRPVFRFADFAASSDGAATVVIASSFVKEIDAALKPHRFEAVYDGLSLTELWRREGVAVRLIPSP